jgi:hypothetical protein
MCELEKYFIKCKLSIKANKSTIEENMVSIFYGANFKISYENFMI